MLRYLHPGWMRRNAILPQQFRPFLNENLVRLGADGDGGYVVDRRSIETAEFLVSGGIDVDWSFEEAFLAVNSVPLYAFDASVSGEIFSQKARSVRRPFSRTRDYQDIGQKFIQFFAGSNQHIGKFIGHPVKQTHIDIDGIVLEYLSHTQRGFFKLDIEGSEYEILDQLASVSSRLTGLAIEFHALHENLMRVIAFIEKTTLKICHIHINNWEPLSRSGVPKVIELSFSPFCGPAHASHALPFHLDKPCCRLAPDFRLGFE